MTDISIFSDDLADFRAALYEECGELLTAVGSLLGDPDGPPLDVNEVNNVFRAVHTVKGSAGFFNIDAIVGFAHTFETLLSAIRENRLSQSASTRAFLVQCVDTLSSIFEASREGRSLPEGFGNDIVIRMEKLIATCDDQRQAPAKQSATDDHGVLPNQGQRRVVEIRLALKPNTAEQPSPCEPLIAQLKQLGQLDIVQRPGTGLAGREARLVYRLITCRSDESIRDAVGFVEHDLELAEVDELSMASQCAGGTAVSAKDAGNRPRHVANAESANREAQPGGSAGSVLGNSWPSGSTIRVDLARVDRLVNVVGRLVIIQAMLAQQVADQKCSNHAQIRQRHEELASYTRELQECVMAIRKQPVRSVFSRMPRLVREIAGKLGKKVRLVTRGEQTEVDKTVIEELADPLLHMIRNAIDHGIESADTRRAAGKPEEGTIELSASQHGGNILITVSDDGAGIDRQRLRRKAIDRGVIPADASLSVEEIDQLIFAPGLSTAETVTEVSGRGVGLDVVRINITNLGGRIQIQSTLGRGTRFTLVLPLTLAVLDGMLVAASNQTYILPLINIIETIRPDKHVVRQLANGSTVVAIRGELITLVDLGDLLGLPGAIQEPWKALVVVVALDTGGKLGIVVDELIGQRQVVVKSLQENSDPVPGFSGATILGTGRVALIIDIEELSRLSGSAISTPRDLESRSMRFAHEAL